VYDVSGLDLSVIARSPDAYWVISDIQPLPDSGTQDETLPPDLNPPGDVVIGGLMGRVEYLTPRHYPRILNYWWNLGPDDFAVEFPSFHGVGEIPNPLSLWYSPYVSGGTAICRINPGATPAAFYRPTYLMPPQWKDFAATAVGYLRTHPELTTPGSGKDRSKEMFVLLKDPNALLDIFVFKTLSEAGTIDPDTARNVLRDARGVTQGVFLLLLMRGPDGPMNVASAVEMVDSAKDPGDVKGLLLGASIGAWYPDTKACHAVGRDILRHGRDKLAVWPTTNPDAKQLKELLDRFNKFIDHPPAEK
jgi:hypothetical protein